MINFFRAQTIFELAKIAGIVEDFVSDKLELAQKTLPYQEKVAIQYRTVNIPGAIVDIPLNPFGENNDVNIMFVFRYHGDARKTAGTAGLKNTIIIYSDVGPMYNKPEYISNSISTILNKLKNEKPNVKLGKWGMTGFSAGYYPIENILNQMNKVKSLVGREPDAVILADAGHTKLVPGAMKGFLEYAQAAANPQSGKKFVSVHSAIPTSYTSTTQHSQWLLDQLNLQRISAKNISAFKNWNQEIQPKSFAAKGNFAVIQADDNPNRVYNASNRDEYGSSGWVHFEIARTVPKMWQRFLYDWD